MIRRVVMVMGLGLAGCAQTYQPIIDTKGVEQTKYQQDLSECRTYAEQVSPAGKAATGGGIGAVLGAALGAIAGAFSGDAGTGAALGASVGAVGGTAEGAGQAAGDQKQIINNCLRGRGYSVLN